MSLAVKKGIQTMNKEIQRATGKQELAMTKSGEVNKIAEMYKIIAADKEAFETGSVLKSRAITFQTKNSNIVEHTIAFSSGRTVKWTLSVKDSTADSWREKFVAVVDEDGKEPIVRTVPLVLSQGQLEGFGVPGEKVEESSYYAFFGIGAPKDLVDLNMENGIDLLKEQEDFVNAWEEVDNIIFLLLWNEPTIQVGLKAKKRAEALTSIVEALVKSKKINKGESVPLRAAINSGKYHSRCGLSEADFEECLRDYELTAFKSFRNDSNSVHGFSIGEDPTNPSIKTPTWIVNMPVWKMKWQNVEMKKKAEEAKTQEQNEPPADEASLALKLKPTLGKRPVQEESQQQKGEAGNKKKKLNLSDQQKREAMIKLMEGDTYIKNTFTFIGPDGKEIPKSDDPIKTTLRNGAVIDVFMKPLIFSNGTGVNNSNAKKDAKAGGKYGYKITFAKTQANLYCNGPEKPDGMTSAKTKYVTTPAIQYTDAELKDMAQRGIHNPMDDYEVDRIISDEGLLPPTDQHKSITGVTRGGKELTSGQDPSVLMDEDALREEEMKEEAERVSQPDVEVSPRKRKIDNAKKGQGNTKKQSHAKKAKSKVADPEPVVEEPEEIMEDAQEQ